MSDNNIIRFPLDSKVLIEYDDNDEIMSCCNFLADQVSDWMKAGIASGDTIVTALLLVSKEIMLCQGMDQKEIREAVDQIFTDTNIRFIPE